MFLQTLPTPGPPLEVHNATKLLLLLLLLSLLLLLLLLLLAVHNSSIGLIVCRLVGHH